MVTRGTAIQVEERPLVDAVATIPHILHNRSGGTTPEEPKESTTGTATYPNSVHTLTGALDDLPVEIVNAISEGQRLTEADYNRALRMRDEVVRVNEEQFQDVDVLVVPLLSEPYASGCVNSIRPTLPFHLAGNPMLSTPMDGGAPVVLVGEHGRDAALLEEALCFLQFVRGTCRLSGGGGRYSGRGRESARRRQKRRPDRDIMGSDCTKRCSSSHPSVLGTHSRRQVAGDDWGTHPNAASVNPLLDTHASSKTAATEGGSVARRSATALSSFASAPVRLACVCVCVCVCIWKPWSNAGA